MRKLYELFDFRGSAIWRAYSKLCQWESRLWVHQTSILFSCQSSQRLPLLRWSPPRQLYNPIFVNFVTVSDIHLAWWEFYHGFHICISDLIKRLFLLRKVFLSVPPFFLITNYLILKSTQIDFYWLRFWSWLTQVTFWHPCFIYSFSIIRSSTCFPH